MHTTVNLQALQILAKLATCYYTYLPTYHRKLFVCQASSSITVLSINLQDIRILAKLTACYLPSYQPQEITCVSRTPVDHGLKVLSIKLQDVHIFAKLTACY